MNIGWLRSSLTKCEPCYGLQNYFLGRGDKEEKTNSVIVSADFFVIFSAGKIFWNGLFGRSSAAMRVTEQVYQIASFGECYRKCIRVINYFYSCFVKHLESLIKLLFRIKIVDSTKWNLHLVLYFYMALQPLVGKGLLIFETSRSHTDTQHWVGLLWTGDQPDAETSTWQRTTITRHGRPCQILRHVLSNIYMMSLLYKKYAF
jgi:hypothetical protein